MSQHELWPRIEILARHVHGARARATEFGNNAAGWTFAELADHLERVGRTWSSLSDCGTFIMMTGGPW